MCAFCAAVPVTAAIGAKLNADQLHKPEEQRKSISKITSLMIGLLIITSITYHTLTWQS
jgi:UDP-N-acetylmuramyl pentapeptide phosphotransferase/UDP-N-acetylglucosamine-1-phosphate transferase